jgi:hypothetical protein
MPMNKSLMSSAKIKTPQFAPLLQAAAFLEKGAVFMPGACNWSRTFADFNLATQQVILGKAPVADAMKQAAKATADRQ